mgnify:CR=1 FL=1
MSELAQANHTTVAHIMELNPHIENPNVIYAGDNIVIPTGDHASNPYAGWNPEWSQSTVEQIHDQEIHHVDHDSIPNSDFDGGFGDEVSPEQISDDQGGYDSFPEETYNNDSDGSSYEIVVSIEMRPTALDYSEG